MLIWGGGSLRKVSMIIFISTIVPVFLGANKYQLGVVLKDKLLLLILWVYVALVVSIFNGNYVHPSAMYYATEFFKIYLFCVLIIALIRTKNDIERLENVILVCFVFFAIWGIDQHFRGNVRLEGMAGSTYDSNGIASLFVLAFPLTLWKLFYSDTKIKMMVGAASLIVIIIAIIFTQSRGGLLGMFAAMFIFFINSKNKIRLVVVGLIFLFTILPFVPEDTKERYSFLESGTDTEELDYSASSRIVLSLAGLKIFQDHPVFGTGFLTFPFVKASYRSHFGSSFPQDLLDYCFSGGKVGHNTYIQILSESGSFASVPYFVILIGAFWSNYSLRKKKYEFLKNIEIKKMSDLLLCIEAGVFGHCVCNLFINNIGSLFLFVQIVIMSILRKLIVESYTKEMHRYQEGQS